MDVDTLAVRVFDEPVPTSPALARVSRSSRRPGGARRLGGSSMPMLVQICIAVVTVALVGVSIALIQAIGRLRNTADQLERTMSRIEQTIPEAERAILEAREVLDTLGNVAKRVDRVVGDFADTGSRIARTTSMVVDEVVNPVTRAAAVVRGVRTGAMTLVDLVLKRRALGAATHNTGGNHYE
jgi:uncharacterized protein YoxC